MERYAREGLPAAIGPALLALQTEQNLPLPAFLDPLDPDRGEVDRHPVLEPRAEESVHVRMGGPALAAVLMDREHALGAPGGSAEGLLHGVTQNPLAEVAVEPMEALRRGVVHGQDEAEVNRAPETAAVLAERLPDGVLVALHGPIPLADSVELPSLPVGQPLLAVRDVAHLRSGSTRVSVVASLDEEHFRPSRHAAPRPGAG